MARVGTNGIGSLVTRNAPDKMPEGALRVAENVSREITGAVSPSKNNYSGLYDTFSTDCWGLAALNYNGANHAIMVGDSYVYEDSPDTTIDVTQISAPHTILTDGFKVYLLNGTKNRVWDGTAIRDHGAPDMSSYDPYDSTYLRHQRIIASITAGADTTITINTGGGTVRHGLVANDRVYLSGLTGTNWTNLNGTTQTVVSATEFSFVIDYDSSTYGAYSGAGYIYGNPRGVTGTYYYKLSYLITLPGGSTIETNALDMIYNFSAYAPDNYSKAITVATTEGVVIEISSWPDISTYTDDSGSATISARLWRTKDAGSDYYLVWEKTKAVIEANYDLAFDTVMDEDLGAIWLDEYDGHSPPPQATMGVFCQQRLFLAGVSGSESTLYISRIGLYDYFDPLQTVELVQRITGLARWGEDVLIFTAGGIKLYSPVDEVGILRDTQSPVGTTYRQSIITTERGTFFARDDGLWVFDGTTARKVSEGVDPTWTAGEWVGAYNNGHAYYTNGTTTFDVWFIGSDVYWSTNSDTGSCYISGDPDDLYIWRIDSGGGYIQRIGVDSTLRTMTIKTADYAVGDVGKVFRVTIDADGSGTATVTTNRGATYSVSFDNATRKKFRTLLPANMMGEFANVTVVTDNATIYDIFLDVA